MKGAAPTSTAALGLTDRLPTSGYRYDVGPRCEALRPGGRRVQRQRKEVGRAGQKPGGMAEVFQRLAQFIRVKRDLVVEQMVTDAISLLSDVDGGGDFTLAALDGAISDAL